MVVVGLDRVFRLQRPFDHRPHEADELDRVLGEVDLAAEEGDPGAVTLGLGDQLEGVARGALGAAENADDQLGRDRSRQAPPWRAGRCTGA